VRLNEKVDDLLANAAIAKMDQRGRLALDFYRQTL
jgi:hypothetical protein